MKKVCCRDTFVSSDERAHSIERRLKLRDKTHAHAHIVYCTYVRIAPMF